MRRTVVASYIIADAARLSGLSPVMLDYLCREKILVPSTPGKRGRGNPRKYSFGDVVMLRVLARLLKSGVAVKRLKKALISLRHYQSKISQDSLPAQYLVTDGSRVYLRNDKRALLDMDGSEQMSFLFVLELEQVRREVLGLALPRLGKVRS